MPDQQVNSTIPTSLNGSPLTNERASNTEVKSEISAEKPKSTLSAASVQSEVQDNLSTPQNSNHLNLTFDSKKQSSISVTLISGEIITKETQPETIDDHSDQTANTQQAVDLSDCSVSSETKKKVNPEIAVEKSKSTEPVSDEATIKQTQHIKTDDQIDQTANNQQSVNTVHTPIPQETEKPEKLQEKTIVNNQTKSNGSPRPRERVKTHAEGHFISEPISDSSDDPGAHFSHLSGICAGVALLGGAVAVGGLIAGSTAVTAIGVTAAVVGGTCCLLEGI